MVEIIIKGLFIGFLTSAPMGPVGVLCVQRTLNEGRLHGLMTGIGASLSDVLFAVIAALGMGFIIDFIEANENPLVVLGSMILLIFGYCVFKSNPAKKLQKRDDIKAEPIWKDFLSSFFLNLTNIGILFFYIAIFTRFNFVSSNQPVAIGVLSIGIGAVLWWLFISYIVDKLRGRFNLRGLVFFNRILGVILVLIGIVGCSRSLYQWLV